MLAKAIPRAGYGYMWIKTTLGPNDTFVKTHGYVTKYKGDYYFCNEKLTITPDNNVTLPYAEISQTLFRFDP